MRLQDSYMGANTPFVGDLTLWLRSLPSGAAVKNVTITLNPTPYNGTIDLTQPTPILGVKTASGTSGSPVTNFFEVNFYARRTLVSVTGSGGSATLQVDMGGIFVGIAPDGTIATGSNDFKVPFTSLSSTFALPGLTVSKFRLSQSSDPLKLTCVNISSIPSNVNVRLGQLPPFWVQTGEVATDITSPDFSKVLNAFLATIQPQNGFYAFPFVIHSDTIACMDVMVDIEYVIDQSVLPSHLSEINLPYTFNQLPDGNSDPPSVNLPEGAVPVAAACTAQISGKFRPTRVALDGAGNQPTIANVLVAPTSSLAQQLPSGKEIAVTAIDLPLSNTSVDLVGLNIAIRDDDNGKPSANVLASTAVTVGKPLPDHSVWGSATLPKPFRITSTQKYWLVLQSQTGQAYWQATPGAAGRPPLQSSSDNGLSWRAATSGEALPPLSALFRLRDTPDRFSIPVQLQIGEGSLSVRRQLDEFAPLGKVAFNFDFASELSKYVVATTTASPSPCGTQDLVVNGNFANPPLDYATLRLFGSDYVTSEFIRSLSFPSHTVDLSSEHFISVSYSKDGNQVPPTKIDCAGAVPARTTLDEIVAKINRKMTQIVQGKTIQFVLAEHNSGDDFFILTPRQGATEVLLYPSNVVPAGWQNPMGQVYRLHQPPDKESSRLLVALVDLNSAESASSVAQDSEISLTQRLPVAAGCVYQLGIRYLDLLISRSVPTDLANWEVTWLDAQGNTLSSDSGTFRPQDGFSSLKNHFISLYVDTLLVAPPNVVNADLKFINAGPDVNGLFLEQVSFVPTTQSISNGDFLQWQGTSINALPTGWALQSGTVSLDPTGAKPLLQGSATEDTVLTQTVNVVAGASYNLQVRAWSVFSEKRNDTRPPSILQHARIELQWSGGASPGATISLVLDGQNFVEGDWTGKAPGGATQAVIRFIQPKTTINANLLVSSVALTRTNDAPIPFTFLSETPGQLTVSNMHVVYDMPEPPRSVGQLVFAPPSNATAASMSLAAVSPTSGEGTMHADAQPDMENTRIRMLLRTIARESSTLRLLRDNPQLIQQRFSLSDDELEALRSADLLRAGDLATKQGTGDIQTGGEQAIEGLDITATGTINPPAYIPGLDVSHHNGTIDWTAVASQGYIYAFAKATEGTSFKDAQFASNWVDMKANSILRGAYHLFRSNQDATRQADHFLQVISALQPGDLPPVLDLETTDGVSGTAILDAAATWLNLVEKASGRTPIIYTSARFWRENLAKAKDPNRFSTHYPVWVAYYTPVPQPPLPDGWTTWTFWQYTDSGKVAGIPVNKGKADLDHFNGSLASLRKLAGL